MSIAMWCAILIAGVGGAAMVLYFVWPDLVSRDDKKKED